MRAPGRSGGSMVDIVVRASGSSSTRRPRRRSDPGIAVAAAACRRIDRL